jgi:hypothetical protein
MTVRRGGASRLDRMIARLVMQRACLAHAATLIAGVPGPVLELGLGKGRTYDHLRERLPGREIFAFDRRIDAHPDCIPDGGHMVLGDFRDTVPAALHRLGRRAALIHFDIGSGDAAANAELARWIAAAAADLLAPGGIAVADQELVGTTWTPLDLPRGIAPGRYYMYRREAA